MRQPEISPHVLEMVRSVRERVHPVDSLDAARTALVVIDMQNFFVEPGQMLEVPAARDIVANVNRLAAATRTAGGTVVWVRMTLDPGALDDWSVFLPVNGKSSSRADFELLEDDKPAHRLWTELITDPADLFVNKTRFSALIHGSSDLQSRLDERGVDTLIIVGTLTNVCCESTGRDAMMLNYRVVMVDDANATTTEAVHRASLDNFFMYFGDVQSTDQVEALLAAPR